MSVTTRTIEVHQCDGCGTEDFALTRCQRCGRESCGRGGGCGVMTYFTLNRGPVPPTPRRPVGYSLQTQQWPPPGGPRHSTGLVACPECAAKFTAQLAGIGLGEFRDCDALPILVTSLAVAGEPS